MKWVPKVPAIPGNKHLGEPRIQKFVCRNVELVEFVIHNLCHCIKWEKRSPSPTGTQPSDFLKNISPLLIDCFLSTRFLLHSGCCVVAYKNQNNQGDSIRFCENIDMFSVDWNDRIRSLKIIKDG